MGVARYSVYERMVLGDSPTNWWRYKSGAELANTVSGAAGSLTKTGTAVEVSSLLTDAVSASEKARDFNGTTGFYTAADHASLDMGANTFSIEMWIRPDSIGSLRKLLDKGTNAYSARLRTDGRIEFQQGGNGGAWVASTVALVAGTTYHLVIAVPASGAPVIYLNAADVTTLVNVQTLVDTATDLNIGRTTTGTQFFDGVISEVALYKGIVLSAERVRQHYLCGSAPFTKVVDTTRYPKVRLEVGFESGPKTEFPKWTALTDRLRSWSFARGRSAEFSQVDTGSWQGVLDNRDRALESGYGASPYSPNVKQTKQLMHSAYWNGVQYDVFRGNVSDYGPSWPEMGADSIAQIQAHDAQKLANLEDLTGALSQQATGARIAAVLTTLGVPTAMQDIDAGIPDVVAVTDAEGTNALAHLQDTAKADPGVVFIDGSGFWVFQDRNHRATNEKVSRAIFGDDTAGGELPYADLRPRDDDADIWNDIRVTVAGTGNISIAADSTSDTDHGTRSKSESLALVTDAQGDAVASYWLALFKDGKRRIPTIVLNGAASPSILWPVLLSAEISWRVLVARRPLNVGVAILSEQHVEGVSMSGTPATWSTTFNLTPADTAVYWELGTAGKSELGSTTWLYI